MMDVQRMRLIVDEVEQGTLPAVARAAALRWCEPEEVRSLTYVRRSANHLFRFLHEGRPYYLRLAHEAERDRSSIAAELDFVQHVADTGLAVARPVRSAIGQLIEDVSSQERHYCAVVFEGVQGRLLEVEELDEAQYRAWGGALALVHRASHTFPPHPARPEWREELREALRLLPANETDVAHILASGLRWLETLPLHDWDYGLLHSDFELDNLIWDGGQVQALDFDDAAYGWYALDFAAALQDVWLAGDGSSATSAKRDERISWFTQGYAALRLLPQGLREGMPRLVILLQAFKIARLLRAYANTSEDTDPPWLARMRGGHQRWLRAKRAVLVRAVHDWT